MIVKKSAYEYIKKIRGRWPGNPRTRIHETDARNKKKRRQEEKKLIKNELKP